MSAPSGPITLEALDLAALLCSRVCHDLISPVGAIVNGLEVLEEDKDEETKTFALDLIKKSAQQASAQLQFCRLAFGAAGSAGAQIDLGDAEKVARGLLEDDKTKIAWNLPRELLPKNRVKLLLNMLLVAAGTIPRGGTLTVDPAEGEQWASASPHRGSMPGWPQATAEPAGGQSGASGRCPCHPAVLHRHSGAGLRAYGIGGGRRRGCGGDRKLGVAAGYILRLPARLSALTATEIKPFGNRLSGVRSGAVAPGDEGARLARLSMRMQAGRVPAGNHPRCRGRLYGRPAAGIPDRDQRESRSWSTSSSCASSRSRTTPKSSAIFFASSTPSRAPAAFSACRGSKR